MPEFGTFTLLLALAASLWAAVTGTLGVRRGRADLVESAAAGLRGALLSLTVASGVLVTLFVTRDFSVRYVAEYSDRNLELSYTIAAFWAGQNGSLLFWAWVLAGTSVLAVALHGRRHRELVGVAIVVLAVTLVTFTALVAFTSNPFERLGFTPSDGAGLNAMLRNWGQLYHPPATFFGYIGFTVPFAFAVAALVTGRLDDEWLKVSRRWILWSWVLLGLGILLGARWAYTELGWGGYWAWDPVENVSLLPWLTATALLHTTVLQERRGKLKVMNLVLAMTTFALTVFGTFLVRSGMAASVHAFAESPAGLWLLGVIVAVVLVGTGLVVWRLPELKDRSAPIRGWTRETVLAVTNVLLLVYTLAIFWGTLFPVLVNAAQGRDVTVGEPFFDRATVPVTVVLLVLLALGPALAWRRAATDGLRRRLALPVGFGVVAGIVALVLDGARHPMTALVLGLSATALVTILGELHRGVHAHGLRQPREHLPAFLGIFPRNPRRYGGALVHLGVVLLIIGVALDVTYRSDERHTLVVGETADLGRYQLTFADLDSEITATRMSLTATLEVTRASGRSAGTIETERYLYTNQEQPRTHVGVRSLVREDIYVILEQVDIDAGRATFSVLLHPGVLWLWVGGGLLLLGGGVAAWPYAARRDDEDERAGPDAGIVTVGAGMGEDH